MRRLISAFLFCALLLFPAGMLPAAQADDAAVFTSGEYSCTLLPDGSAEIVKVTAHRESVELPSSLEGYTISAIGDCAFENGKGIKSITIPDSIQTVGINPFSSCSTLEKIFVSPTHPTLAVVDGVLFSKPDSRLVCFPVELFTNYYTVPDGIREIGSRAFFNSEHLVSITIPESVKLIGESAFSVCSYLENVNILGGVTKIGDYAFHLCERLLSVKLADSVTEIGRYAFLGCRKLNDLTVPQSVTDIGEGAFLQVPR